MSDPIGPGDRVECVDDGAHSSGIWTHDPIIKGHIYTVWAIVDVPTRGTGLVLEEVKNAPWFEFSYDIRRFRPLRSDQHSIEVFKRLDADVFNKQLVQP